MQPAHVKLTNESALVLLQIDYFGHAAVVGRWQISLEDLQNRRLARQERREDFLCKFPRPLLDHILRHLRPAPPQAIHDRLNRRHFLEHHQLVLWRWMPHQLDVIRESIGVLSWLNEMHLASDEVMQFAKQRQAQPNERRRLLNGESVR